MNTFKVTIQENPSRGPNVWAWAADYGDEYAAAYDRKFIGLGHGHDFDSCTKLARKHINKFKKYLIKHSEEA